MVLHARRTNGRDGMLSDLSAPRQALAGGVGVKSRLIPL
jgi:hypothetical protein